MKKKLGLQSRLLHQSQEKYGFFDAIATPIFQSSTFKMKEHREYIDIKYSRLSNTPNHLVLHDRLASAEGTEEALVTSSGMSAITTALVAHLKQGDHLLAQDCLYGGTFDFLKKDFRDLGIEFDFVDLHRPETWKSKVNSKTRGFYVESLTNPLLQVGELSQVVKFCHEHDLVSFIDNTFLSPVNFRPAEMGFDIVLHSATKYLNGHSDLICGAIMASTKHMENIKLKLAHFGGSLDPHACFLLERGLKTLTLRVRQQNQNAQKIAQYLLQQNEVEKVHYVGLETHPDHSRASEWFDGYGGVLSFELNGAEDKADQFIAQLKLAHEAPSLGGVETLITRPSTSSHSGLSNDDLISAGISKKLVRVAVGVEEVEDLIDDFDQSLKAL